MAFSPLFANGDHIFISESNTEPTVIILLAFFAAFILKVHFCMVLIAEELEENPFNTNLLSIRNVELSNSFKSLELDTDSSRGSGESLDSLASSVVDDQSLVRSRASSNVHQLYLQQQQLTLTLTIQFFTETLLAF